ncbi:hypothetical protein QL285_044813 [Trifolium repens]|nr:hypothetical protein QL285_044813 [Trifolium repens]
MPPRVAPPEPQLDHSSPFYVHLGDGPSSVTVTPLLTGSNYHSWSRSMKRALGAKMKLDFIDGTLPVPADAFDLSYQLSRASTSQIREDIESVENIRISDNKIPQGIYQKNTSQSRESPTQSEMSFHL